MFAKDKIGRRKCLELYQSKREPTHSGSAKETLERKGELYGEIKTLTGYRLDIARKTAEGATHRVLSNYFDPVPDKSHRLKVNNRWFTIEAVIDVNFDNTEMEFYCKEIR